MNPRERIARWLSPLLDVALRGRTTVKFFLTLGIFLSANYLAWLIRFEFDVPPNMIGVIRQTIPVLVIAKALGFLASGQFRGWWRYMSIRDVLPIAAGCTLGSVLFAATVWGLWGPFYVPRSIYLLDWGITMMLVLGARYLIRMGREGLGRRGQATERRVLIVGAGAAGQMIAREIAENASLGMEQVGFIDDDRQKIGTRIHGVKVLGGHGQISALCGKYDVNEIIIAMPSTSASVVRHIVEHCREVSAVFRILPGFGDLIDGKVSIRALRNVDLEDLLGRDAVALDTDLLHRHITGRTVMVTGAAGSIGSELCRQIA
ncbi:MAG: PglD-related sugar-binding protein, partial [Candidatus Deferrimicrobiaceae bacterium]